MKLDLPSAPKHYSQTDQNELRRILERNLAEIEARLQALEALAAAL